jgi:hypothetical protein
MSRYSTPSPFGQGGTSDPRRIGVGYSNDKSRNFGENAWLRQRRAAELRSRIDVPGVGARHVAVICGVTRATVQEWLKGEMDIPAAAVITILAAFPGIWDQPEALPPVLK